MLPPADCCFSNNKILLIIAVTHCVLALSPRRHCFYNYCVHWMIVAHVNTMSHRCFYKCCRRLLIYSSRYYWLRQDCQKLLLLWKFLLLPGICCQWMLIILTPWQQCHCLLRYPMTLPTLAQHGSHSQLIVTILHFSFFLLLAFFLHHSPHSVGNLIDLKVNCQFLFWV